jgi:S-adenosylmethionine synthetase
MNQRSFTSESVTEGHPDKVADRISDTILDEVLSIDRDGRVACETFVTTDLVVIGGEIRFTRSDGGPGHLAPERVESLVRDAVSSIGYTGFGVGFDAGTLTVQNHIHRQSDDIAGGVDRGDWRRDPDELGAGDQGLMFGYASDETPALMPLPIQTAHRLARALTTLRVEGTLDYLRPDGKTQVTVRYEDDRPVAIERLLVSSMHAATVTPDDVAADLRHALPTLLPDLDLEGAAWTINPAGPFVTGGPDGDAGLTGRKIIVDTYGGMARHGGGAFSGKDPSKVDRSASYAARWVAKHVVAAGLARRCELQVAYAIGKAAPESVHLETFGTETVDPAAIGTAIGEVFDLRPAGILIALDLCRPIYTATSAYGHFGRPEFPWEETPRIDALRAAVGA